MTDLLTLARSKRAALAQELEQLDQFIRTAEQLTRELTPADGGSRRGAPISEATYAAAREFLNKRNRPAPISELLPAVQAMGVEVGGKDPGATLSARLSNSSEFKTFRGLGWWFAERPLPDVSGTSSVKTEGVTDATPSNVFD